MARPFHFLSEPIQIFTKSHHLHRSLASKLVFLLNKTHLFHFWKLEIIRALAGISAINAWPTVAEGFLVHVISCYLTGEYKWNVAGFYSDNCQMLGLQIESLKFLNLRKKEMKLARFFVGKLMMVNAYCLGLFYEPPPTATLLSHLEQRQSCVWWRRLRCPGKGARCNSDTVCPGNSKCCLHACDIAYCTTPVSSHKGNIHL